MSQNTPISVNAIYIGRLLADSQAQIGITSCKPEDVLGYSSFSPFKTYWMIEGFEVRNGRKREFTATLNRAEFDNLAGNLHHIHQSRVQTQVNSGEVK